MPGEWYQDGLRFECTMCGACCSGGEGVVRFTMEEAAAAARRLKIDLETFMRTYTRQTPMGASFNEVPTEFGLDCVFLDRKIMPGKAVCSLYEDRPTQCRTFPFWPEHLASRRSWNALSRECEGIGRSVLVPIEAIRIEREKQRGQALETGH